jgi:hypothetical protein
MHQATARLVVNRYLREMEYGLDRLLEHPFLNAAEWTEKDTASFATSLASWVEFSRDRQACAISIYKLIEGTDPGTCPLIFPHFVIETNSPVQFLACPAFHLLDFSRTGSQPAELEKWRAEAVDSLRVVRRSIRYAVQ